MRGRMRFAKRCERCLQCLRNRLRIGVLLTRAADRKSDRLWFLLPFLLGCGVSSGGGWKGAPDRSQVACGDKLCPVGQTCLGACYGVPPETLYCVAPLADSSCPVGAMRARCRGSGGQETLGCRPVGSCVPVHDDCSTTEPSCGCFDQSPCVSGSCHDEAGRYACPPCA